MSRALPLTPELSSRWAAAAQIRFLDALMVDPGLTVNQIAFHGGTSLHFSWRSPRRSEDLDFLVAKNFGDIQSVVEKAGKKTEETFRADDPEFVVEIANKTKRGDRLISHELKISHPDYLGKTLVKVEFWRVEPEYLLNYPVEMRSPIEEGDMVSRISNPVPAASLEAAYCDKLTAFATRPYLKWRDIYDLWWIGTQTDSKLGLSSVVPQFLHNVSAYTTVNNLSPAQALRKFLEGDPAEIVRKADPDLKRWLPESLWGRLHPQVTAEMVRYVRDALQSVADAIENDEFGASLKRIRP